LKRHNAILATVTVLFALAGSIGCTAAHSSQTATTPPKAARDPGEIEPKSDLLSQLKVGPPEEGSVSDTLEIAGRIEANESRVARVSSPVSGRITELHVVEGEVVHRGQPLASLYSNDLSLQQFVLIKALSSRQVAERAVDRAKQLLKAEVIGAAELQRREAELQQATAEVGSARDQLRLLGMSPESIDAVASARTANSEGRILASVDGTVMERKVTLGQLVQPSDSAFVICDLSSLWLIADIPEQNAGNLRAGKAVQAEIAAFPGKLISGHLSFVSAVVNAETRTVRARMDLPNENGLYKPEMLALVKMRDTAAKKNLVPIGAVVRENNDDFVFVREGERKFRMRRVTLGSEFEGRRVLVDGLRPGDVIVLDGAFHLNNERKRLMTEGSAS
jgi:cobalt-zinc-cadmium efflux system membrane fusion protein